jgi:hypothetical protein
MGKDKYFFLALTLLIFILAFLSFIYKSYNLFTYEVLTAIILFILLFWQLGRIYKVKVFQFLIGDFVLSDSLKVNKFIYDTDEIKIYRLYLNSSWIAIFLFLLFFNDVSLLTLIIPGLTLISIGTALSILTFNYSRATDCGIENNFIYSSAKRFFLSTIYAILMLLSIMIYKIIPVITNLNISFSPFPFAIASIQSILMGVILIFISFFFIKAFRYLFEGFVLSINETIIFDK